MLNKTKIAFISLFPIIFHSVWIFFWIFSIIASLYLHNPIWILRAAYLNYFTSPIYSIVGIWTFFILISYIRDAKNNIQISDDKKTTWYLLLLSLGLFTIPAYYYLYISKREKFQFIGPITIFKYLWTWLNRVNKWCRLVLLMAVIFSLLGIFDEQIIANIGTFYFKAMLLSLSILGNVFLILYIRTIHSAKKKSILTYNHYATIKILKIRSIIIILFFALVIMLLFFLLIQELVTHY